MNYFDLYYLLKEYSLNDMLEKSEIKIIPPAYEDLIIALKETIFEGEVVTDRVYDIDDFKKFIESLMLGALDYARNIH